MLSLLKEKNNKEKSKMSLGTSKSQKKKPRATTVQKTIPYQNVYRNGIIETEIGTFTKLYQIQDINFQIEADSIQEQIYLGFGDFLNSFSHETKFQIVTFNRTIDKEKFKANTLLPLKRDANDKYREEYNKMLLDKMQEGRNNLVKEKYLIVSLNADDIEQAIGSFARIDGEVSALLKKINKVETLPMPLEERLSLLYSIYNLNTEVPFYNEKIVDGSLSKSFDLEHIKRMGLSTKDVIGPSGFTFERDHFRMGDTYGRTLYLEGLPTFLSTEFINDVGDMPCNLLISTHYESYRQDKAVKLIRNLMTDINSNVVNAQQRASRAGYSNDLISPDLMKSKEEAASLLGDITSRNQKLFLTTFTVTLFSSTLEELEKLTKTLSTIANKHLCVIKKMLFQQELAFNSTMPFATNKIYSKRLLTTESASIFLPFSTQEITQINGKYYGLNGVSKNMVLYNRGSAKNQNGLIFGVPGSGKSFKGKEEMVATILGTEDEVYIIDPEDEYSTLVELLGGQVIRVALGSNININPMDMDLNYADDDDPIKLKTDFLISLCQTMIGGRYGLSPVQTGILDRCIGKIYEPYMEHLQSTKKTFDSDMSPTLQGLYECLLSQEEMEAEFLALSLERYCKGSLDIFSKKTNIQKQNRIVCYNIKDIGKGMKAMGLQVCMNDIWNRMIINRKSNRKTWFYIDEFHLLLQDDLSANFSKEIWKRARKWGGIPTGITQNVEDLLRSEDGRAIVNTSEFIVLLSQSHLDRQALSTLYNLSPTQLSYITSGEPGQGLLLTGKTIIPIIDSFPKDTELYKAMTTNPNE